VNRKDHGGAQGGPDWKGGEFQGGRELHVATQRWSASLQVLQDDSVTGGKEKGGLRSVAHLQILKE